MKYTDESQVIYNKENKTFLCFYYDGNEFPVYYLGEIFDVNILINGKEFLKMKLEDFLNNYNEYIYNENGYDKESYFIIPVKREYEVGLPEDAI